MLPLSLYALLNNKKCLVVGDNPTAIQHAQLLTEKGAAVTLICDSTVEIKVPVHSVLTRRFQPNDIDGHYLVIAASADQNKLIADSCDEKHVLCHVIANPKTNTPAKGETGMVYLVGAGPGAPDLLTIRALHVIRDASVIVHDRLVSCAILELCNPDALFIYAGKAKAQHAIPQQSINQLLVDLAREHKNVVRLKGGDPFIFGRGGEEIETLFDNQVSFQMIPGITAASGCASYAGIPLTHRDHAQSVVFITGHLRNGNINLNWAELNNPTQTIVVYMGLTGLPVICEALINQGRNPDTPAALIEQGTTEKQRVFSSTLKELPALVETNSVTAPTLLIIGGVVSLREKLDWYNPGTSLN